jgi:signal transduction histidine kinase
VDAANAVAREHEARARLTRATERADIAREMHDIVAHSITVMVALGGGASMALEKSPQQAQVALDELVSTGRTALTDMRRVLGALDAPADRAEPGSAPTVPAQGSIDLPALVDRFRMAGLTVRATGIGGALDDADAGLQLAVYRILQESLTNVLRHAPGTRAVEVDVRSHPDIVQVTVTDHGSTKHTATGRDEAGEGSQRGLIGIRERAAVLGGTVQAGPHGDGWRVRVDLPSQPSAGETR